jgi:tetraacyldisaccharide 4'-kinase
LQAPPATIESVLSRAWMRRGLLACLLWPLSLVFRLMVAVRRGLYTAGIVQTVRLPVPVIMVGNVFIGGTGKTPFAIWLIEHLRAAGYSPGVISRGYAAAGAMPRLVRSTDDPRACGDEPVLIAARAQCPLAIGRDRVAAARLLLDAHPEINVLVGDDGLQHYRLGRDIEILVSDQRGAGNGWLLPAGPLREPLPRRADFRVVNGAAVQPPEMAMHLEGAVAERLSDRSQRMPLAALRSKGRLAAAAGIGHPERFFTMLRGAGLEFEALPLDDHFDFSVNPFAQLQADLILITEKDAVKCLHVDALRNDARLWVVPVSARIDPLAAERIVEKLRGYTTA